MSKVISDESRIYSCVFLTINAKEFVLGVAWNLKF